VRALVIIAAILAAVLLPVAVLIVVIAAAMLPVLFDARFVAAEAHRSTLAARFSFAALRAPPALLR